MKVIIFLMLSFTIISCGIGKKDVPQRETDRYIVRSVEDNMIVIDGLLNEAVWDSAEVINNFTLPWEKVHAQPTEFRALYDHDTFYFAFRVKDTQVVVLDTIKTEKDLVREDRVEVYLAFDKKLSKQYYCVEIDSKGRILDYLATYPRIFDFNASWGPINSAATKTVDGYSVEAAISLRDMKNLGFNIDGTKTKFRAALFRADFEKGIKNSLIKHWQVWVNPNLPEPDYHVPTSFGDFIFDK